MKDFKAAAKHTLFMVATGGLYFIAMLVKILFTTPEGQAVIEREFKKKVKAYNLEEERKEKTETKNQIGFRVNN